MKPVEEETVEVTEGGEIAPAAELEDAPKARKPEAPTDNETLVRAAKGRTIEQLNRVIERLTTRVATLERFAKWQGGDKILENFAADKN